MTADLLVPLAFVFAFYLSAYIVRPFVTIFHELGHAFAHLIFDRNVNVKVFIGSYGNTNNAFTFKIGRLRFYVARGFPFKNVSGACRVDILELNYFNEILILLAGPFLSFGLACAAIFLGFHFDLNGVVKFFILFSAIWALVSLILSLRPRTINSANLDTDGKQILFTIRIRKVYHDYASGYNDTLQGKNSEAVGKLWKALDAVPNEPKILKLLAANLKNLKDYEHLENCLMRLSKVSNLSATDYIDIGYSRSVSHRHQEAIESYSNALSLDANNQFALNNLAYEKTYCGDYDEAEKLLNKAIALDPEFGYSYSYLGYLKILRGQLEEGRRYIEQSIEKHSDDAYAYKHLGVYYLKIGEKDLAKINFQRAIDIEPIVDLENYLFEVEKLA